MHRVTDGTFRACLACATARSRCSGGTPCGRCESRKIECAYPSKRRKIPTTADDDYDIVKDETVAFQVQPRSEPQERSYRPHEPIRFVDAKGFSVTEVGHQRLAPSLQQAPVAQTPGQYSDTSYGSQGPRHQGPPHQNTHDPEAVHQPLSAPVALSNDQHYPDMTVPSQVPADFASQQGAYGYPAWDEPLNWIPISVYPSPYDGELEHDVSFFFPPLSDASTLGIDYGSAIPVDPTSQIYQVPPAGQQHEQHVNDGRSFSVTFSGLANSPTSSASNEQSGPRSGGGSAGLIEGKKKRRKSSVAPDLFARPRRHGSHFAFPIVTSAVEEPDFHPQQYCSPQAYDAIAAAFTRLCQTGLHYDPFGSVDFPDIDAFNRYVDLYFQNFHVNFPLIHRSTFGQNSHWLPMLATATIGCGFVTAPYMLELREAFQELLRRVIGELSDTSLDLLDLPLAQARLLNLVSLANAEADETRLSAARGHAALSHWCLEAGVLQLPDSGDQVTRAARDGGQASDVWSRWIRVESLRRVAYLTWLMDTSLAYLSNVRPLCNMDDARTPLPCPESLWQAASSQEWQSLYDELPLQPSLCAALEYLYAKKAVPPGLSDLCQTLLINALFQRTWEVGTHIKQPMSEWVPTGKARGFLNTPSKDDFWLPLYPLYANWRNSACDCLDIINWQAASIVAKASGVEHHLMLHLHLARIILLTPFQEIQDLLFSLIGRVGDSSRASFYVHDGSYQPRTRSKLPQIRKITWRWLRDDQHKARLAMVHAGSVFWHVRRYSSMSFYEPLAVYLASLVLWTYGSYKTAALERNATTASSRPVGGPSGPDADLTVVQPSRVERKLRTQDSSDNHEATAGPDPEGKQAHELGDSDSSSDSSEDQPEFIHLDRPCDDEMIQHFVRNGHTMTGHMSNVGDICKAPQKILLEGAKLLRTRLSCWGVSREYYDILTRLAEMRKG